MPEIKLPKANQAGLRTVVQLGLLVVALMAWGQHMQMAQQVSASGQLRELQINPELQTDLIVHTNQSNCDNDNEQAMTRMIKNLKDMEKAKSLLEQKLELAQEKIQKLQEDTENVDKQTQLLLELHQLKDEKEELQRKLDESTDASTAISTPAGVSSTAIAAPAFGGIFGSEADVKASGPRSPSHPAKLIQSNLKLQLGTKELREEQNYTNPACTLQTDDDTIFNRIVLLHMRKAGGSSVRNYLRHLAGIHKVPLFVMEGHKDVELPGDNDKTLYITHLREPISRTISHYKYEQRWDCREQHWNPNVTVSPENQKMTLGEFADREFRHRNQFWACSKECLTRWSIGCHQIECLDPDSDLEVRARKVLNDYHLIIVSEWLRDENYSRSLEAIFGLDSINRKKGMACGEASAAANKKFPVNITQDDYDLLASNHVRDMRMYQEMTVCPQGPQFWNRRIRFEEYEVPEGQEPLPMNFYIPPKFKKE